MLICTRGAAWSFTRKSGILWNFVPSATLISYEKFCHLRSIYASSLMQSVSFLVMNTRKTLYKSKSEEAARVKIRRPEMGEFRHVVKSQPANRACQLQENNKTKRPTPYCTMSDKGRSCLRPHAEQQKLGWHCKMLHKDGNFLTLYISNFWP